MKDLGISQPTAVRESVGGLLAADHRLMEELLDKALRHPRVDLAAYDQFRARLLRHIGIEEKILLPAAERVRGEPIPSAARLRLEHGAIAALLVPPPRPEVIRALRFILEQHNHLEEDAGGVYELCDRMLGEEADMLATQIRLAPDVPLAIRPDTPRVTAAARRALERAGYDPALLDQMDGPAEV